MRFEFLLALFQSHFKGKFFLLAMRKLPFQFQNNYDIMGL